MLLGNARLHARCKLNHHSAGACPRRRGPILLRPSSCGSRNALVVAGAASRDHQGGSAVHGPPTDATQEQAAHDPAMSAQAVSHSLTTPMELMDIASTPQPEDADRQPSHSEEHASTTGVQQASTRQQQLMSVDPSDEPADHGVGGSGSSGWPMHQHVLQLMAGGLLASGLLVGGYFWARWGMGKLAAARAAREAQAAGLDHAGMSREGGSAVDPAAQQGRTHGGSGGLSSRSSHDAGVVAALEAGGGPAVGADRLDDPFAALRYALSGWVPAWRKEVEQRGQLREGGVQRQGGAAAEGAVPAEGREQGREKEGGAREEVEGGRASSRGGGGEPPLVFPTLPEGWWRGLTRVHYANFGARLGILPRLPAKLKAGEAGEAGVRSGSGEAAGGDRPQQGKGGDGGSSSSSSSSSTTSLPSLSLSSGALSQGLIVAFEDPVDAEFVATALRRGMARRASRAEVQSAAPSSQAGGADSSAGLGDLGADGTSTAADAEEHALRALRAQVSGTSPAYLEDVSMAQGAELAVIPRDLLPTYYGTQLNEAMLLRLLGDILTGSPASVQPARPAPQHTPRSLNPPAGFAAQAAATPFQPPPEDSSTQPAAEDDAGSNGSTTTSSDRADALGNARKDGEGGGGPKAANRAADSVAQAQAELEKLGLRLPSQFDFPGFDAPPVMPPDTAPAAAEAAGAQGAQAQRETGEQAQQQTGEQGGEREAESAEQQQSTDQESAEALQQQQSPQQQQQQEQQQQQQGGPTAGSVLEASEVIEPPSSTLRQQTGPSPSEPSTSSPGHTASHEPAEAAVGSGTSAAVTQQQGQQDAQSSSSDSSQRSAEGAGVDAELLEEYEAFKQMFMSQREGRSRDGAAAQASGQASPHASASSTPASDPPSSTDQPASASDSGAGTADTTAADANGPRHSTDAAGSEDSTGTGQPGPTSTSSSSTSTSHESSCNRSGSSSSRDGSRQRNAVEQLLAEQGPTEHALAQANAMIMGMPNTPWEGNRGGRDSAGDEASTAGGDGEVQGTAIESDLLREWYELQEQGRQEQQRRQQQQQQQQQAFAQGDAVGSNGAHGGLAVDSGSEAGNGVSSSSTSSTMSSSRGGSPAAGAPAHNGGVGGATVGGSSKARPGAAKSAVAAAAAAAAARRANSPSASDRPRSASPGAEVASNGADAQQQQQQGQPSADAHSSSNGASSGVNDRAASSSNGSSSSSNGSSRGEAAQAGQSERDGSQKGQSERAVRKGWQSERDGSQKGQSERAVRKGWQSERDGSSAQGSGGQQRPRAWGSWASNPRIRRAGVSLLSSSRQGKQGGGSKPSTSGNGAPGSSNSSGGSSKSSSMSGSGSKGSSSAGSEKGGGEEVKRTEDGAVIVSQRAGHSRPWKRIREPAERQATVKEAMRAASSGLTLTDDEDGPSDPTAFSWNDRDSGASSRSSSGRAKWWQRRFQVLYMPTVCGPDGAVGFVQLDVSLNPDIKDVRVVTFEDRHDCMHCLTIMKQWPEYEEVELSIHAIPTKNLEEQVQEAWLQQVEAAESTGVPPASRPSGLVVLRRGKLAMRVGMSLEEFTQLIVYQAAAQVSLAKVGYEFDDF